MRRVFLVMSSPAPRRFHWEIVYPPPGPKRYIDPEKSPERVPNVESEEDPEEDPEEEEEPMKKQKVSESDSNTWPLDYTAPTKETDLDLDSIARSEAKPEDLEDT
ncbi:hypothetical protein Tco_0397905 [Tanacetum coccineum]